MNLIQQEQILIKDIFLIRCNPSHTGDSLVSLTQFPKEVATLGSNVSLVTNPTYFDSLLMDRLQLPKTDILSYLAESLARCNYQSEKPWNQTPEIQAFIKYSIDIIRNFIYMALLDTEIFPEQHIIDTEAEKCPDRILAVAMRIMTFFELKGFDFDVFNAVYPRIEEQENGKLFLQNFIQVILARQRFQTILDGKCYFYITTLQALLGVDAFKHKFVTLTRTPFFPEKKGLKFVTGNMIDMLSPLGMFARPSIMGSLASYNQEVKANLNLENRILEDFEKIRYKKEFEAKTKHYHEVESEYLGRLKQIFKNLFKKDTQRVMFEWLYGVVVGNITRTKLGTRLSGVVTTNISHDGLMLNVYECMLEISKVILDKSNNRYQSIDPNYLRVSERFKMTQYEPLNNKKIEGVLPHTDKTEFGTITEFFFLTLELVHVGVVPTMHNFNQVMETKQRIENEMKRLDRKNFLYPKYEAELRRFKVKYFQYYLALMDDSRMKVSVKLLDMVLFLLPKWLGIDINRFRDNRIEGYKKSLLLNWIPEHLLNNVYEFHHFYIRTKENYLDVVGEQHINSILTITCLLLSESQISSNPYVCANYIELLFYFLMIPKSPFLQSLANSEVALNNITVGLVRFYSDIAFTGSSHQFYSKYKYRYYCNKIFTSLWKHESYRKQLRQIRKTQQFERFINMVMTDTTYCFDETAEKYDKLKEYEMKRQNGSLNQEDARGEEMISGAMQANLQQSTSNLKLLKELSSWSPETFLSEAFITLVVPLLDNILRTLVDPTSFVANRQLTMKYKFDKAFVLSDVLNIYANLNIGESFVNEIIRDDRYYKKEYFTTALQRAGNENCTEEVVLEKFEQLINQLSNAKKEQEDEEIYGEIPDKYLCSLMTCLMKDPVLLPTSNHVVQRMYIHRHLLNDERDPFNRKPLKTSELIEQLALKKEIEDWKKKRLEELKSSKSNKYGKKAEKKKEEETDEVLRDNFMKYQQ